MLSQLRRIVASGPPREAPGATPASQPAPDQHSAETIVATRSAAEAMASVLAQLQEARDELARKQAELHALDQYLFHASTNGLHGFDYNRIASGNDVKRSLRFVGSCALWPVIGQAIGYDHEVDQVALAVDENRNAHFSPALSELERFTGDANIVAIPLRAVMAGGAVPLCGFGNEIYWPRCLSEAESAAYFAECASYVRDFVGSLAELMDGTPTFFLSFWEPRQNFMGNLLPRFGYQNPQYFTSRLNEELERAVRVVKGAYLLDVNDVLNSMGRFRVQDDYSRELSHGAGIFDADCEDDDRRILASTKLTEMYMTAGQIDVLGHSLLNRILDNIAILKSEDPVKIIIVDLDDTLWRGVLADGDRSVLERSDHWPMGLAEALLVFKARGGLLAICSKNDEALAKAEFERVWGGRLHLSDFVAVKINFDPKSHNILSILEDVNLLPGNALFIDDNPREIDEVTSAIPELRTLSHEHFDWRREILLSPATQVASITRESTTRTESLKAKMTRDTERKKLSREEWLASLALKARYTIVRSPADPDFNRTFELLNKTNQFNTSGRRWSLAEMSDLLGKGGYILCAFLSDKMADNGLIGLHVVLRDEIVQSILSCRVFGLNSEYGSMHLLTKHMLSTERAVRARFTPTGKNFYCERFYEQCGFRDVGGEWVLTTPVAHPASLASGPDPFAPAIESAGVAA